MQTRQNEAPKSGQRTRRATSATLDDGTLVELVYDPRARHTAFVVWQGGSWRVAGSHRPPSGERLLPYSAENNLIKNDVVLLPSEPQEYGTEADLVTEIQAYIHRYVDLSPEFERLASYYVLLSWLYDGFNELPYLRIRGDYGTGKTRFLLIVGSLCYKPIFASGASTVSPIFHILEAFRGTLVIDEGDFRFSDEKADVVKILNNGNVRGLPVLRTEVSKTGEYNPRAFQVFGPKIVATRGCYDDRALESRFITEVAGDRGLRDDIPINLPASYEDEALELRNKLLMYRFRNHGRRPASDALVDPTIEPRLNQIYVPLLSVVSDEGVRDELRAMARGRNRELIAERGMDTEAQVLEVIHVLAERGAKLSVKEITEAFVERFGKDYDRPITTRWIGFLLRRKLHLRTQKSHGNFVVPIEETPKLERLYGRYGLSDRGSEPGDMGDDGEVAELPGAARDSE